jgi:hypothetical protein
MSLFYGWIAVAPELSLLCEYSGDSARVVV